jgi:hypothetical protein
MIHDASGPNAASPIIRLLNASLRPGSVNWIGLRPCRRQNLVAVSYADLDPDYGLIGDHYRSCPNRPRIRPPAELQYC